jgi:transposase
MLKVKQKVDFSGKKVEVGIDVHSKKWNVSLFLDGSFIKRFQQPPGVKTLPGHLKENYPGADYHLAYEAGFCGFWISRQFREEGMDCIVINPGDLPQTNKARNNKTDDRDSRAIGAALSGGMLKVIYIPSPEQESDRLLVRYRLRLQRDIGRCQLRIKSMLYQLGVNIPPKFKYWTKAFIQWLKDLSLPFPTGRITLDYMIDQLLLLRQKMLAVLKNVRQLQERPKYQKQYDLLRSVPGIGPITAITLLTEIGDINRFGNFYRFNSFIGFCPTEYSSGEKERRGPMTFRHHAPLRELLIEASWTAIKHDPALTLAYEELKKKMGGKRAIVKIARKLLNRIFTIWKNQEIYEMGLA